MAERRDATQRPHGPMWTKARLLRVMRLRFGSTPRGGVKTAAVAEAMGVSTRTVQRWLHASSGRSLAHIPAKRLEQLIALLLPSAETLRDEAQAERYAREAIAAIAMPKGRGVLESWKRQRWVEPHEVAVLQLGKSGLLQITVARPTSRDYAQLGRRGKVLDVVEVPTRFHGTMLVHRVLELVRPWRMGAPDGLVRRGPTQCWLADAPKVSLADVLAEVTDPGTAAPSEG